MNQIGWIDFSRSHYNKVMSVMDMFADQGVIDELGLGTIRDSISDLLFPGISTIQTRAKYFLLIPWIFQDIERNGKIDRFFSELEQSEIHFIKTLRLNSKDEGGIIGATLRNANPKRKPSSVYWNGLITYGIRHFKGSITDYINYVQRHHKMKANRKKLVAEGDGNVPGDDTDATHLYQNPLWCQLPTPPADWKENLTIKLTQEEALFLCEVITRSSRNSLWANILRHDIDKAISFSSIDDFLHLPNLPEELKVLLQIAIDFNLIMQGAFIRYNLLIQRNRENGRDAELLPIWDSYLKKMKNFHWDIWNSQVLWKLFPYIHISTQRFVENWIETIKGDAYWEAKGDQLIKDRELRLKGFKRARLFDKSIAQKQQAFTGITVQAGEVYYLNYRWAVARIILTDIQNGLNKDAETK